MGLGSTVHILGLLGYLAWTQCGPIERRVDYTGHRVVTVWPRGLAQLQLLAEIEDNEQYGIDFWSEPVANRSIDLHIPPDSYQEVCRLFEQANITYRVKIEDIQSLIKSEESPDGAARRRRDVQTTSDVVTTGDVEGTGDADRKEEGFYYVFSIVGEYARVYEINMWMGAAVRAFPEIASVFEIGRSYEGWPLKVIKIGSQSASSKPAIWLDGGIHAREWIAPATAVYIIDKLLTGYDVDDTVTAMVDTYDWYILPVVNPDGYEYTHTIDRLWRKTRRPIYGFPRCKGVDANRNYNYSWGGGCASNMFSRCASASPCRLTYAGEFPFSEPETSAMADFLLEHKEQMKVYLSFHAYSQLWLTNWGDSPVPPEDYNDLTRVARKGTAALRQKYGTTYIIGSPARILYAAGGTSYDWAKGVAGIKYSYILELRDLGRYGFILPKSQIIPTGQETWDAMKVVAMEVAKELPSRSAG